MHSLVHRANTVLTFFGTVAATLAILTACTGETKLSPRDRARAIQPRGRCPAACILNHAALFARIMLQICFMFPSHPSASA